MPDPRARITEAELQILKALWRSAGPMTGTAIVAEVSAATSWNPSTIKTLVKRLVDKGAVSAERRDVLHYAARIGEADFAAFQADRLIDSFYSGKASGLVAALFDQKRLSAEDLAEIRRRIGKEKRHG